MLGVLGVEWAESEKDNRKERKEKGREEEKESNVQEERVGQASGKPVWQPDRQPGGQSAQQPASHGAVPSRTVRLRIGDSCLNRGLKGKCPRAQLDVHFTKCGLCDLSEQMLEVETNSWAAPTACFRVVQRVPQSEDLQVHTDWKWSLAKCYMSGRIVPGSGKPAQGKADAVGYVVNGVRSSTTAHGSGTVVASVGPHASSTTRRTDRLSEQLQHEYCSPGHAPCEGQGNRRCPFRPEMYRPKAGHVRGGRRATTGPAI